MLSIITMLGINILSLWSITNAQDPASGWLGYALGKHPQDEVKPITFIEAYWVNLNDPKNQNCFYSPWFGIETSDNLNLLQPVNPWNGNEWSIYNEYFQWKPVHNENSQSHVVYPGDLLYGSVTFNSDSNSYTLYHADLTQDHQWSVNMTVDVQKTFQDGYKTYNMIYVVFEKVCRQCDMYPPNDIVTFTNISVYWDNVKLSPSWTTDYVEDVCNNRAKVIDDSTIAITWDSTSQVDYTELYNERENNGTNGNLKRCMQ